MWTKRRYKLNWIRITSNTMCNILYWIIYVIIFSNSKHRSNFSEFLMCFWNMGQLYYSTQTFYISLNIPTKVYKLQRRISFETSVCLDFHCISAKVCVPCRWIFHTNFFFVRHLFDMRGHSVIHKNDDVFSSFKTCLISGFFFYFIHWWLND